MKFKKILCPKNLELYGILQVGAAVGLKEGFKAPFEFVFFYKDDFQPDLLHAQLLIFGVDFQATYREVYDERTPVQPRIFDIRDYCMLFREVFSAKYAELCS